MSERGSGLTWGEFNPIFRIMRHESHPTAIHSMRVIASFALLGAVLMGVLAGWADEQTVDVRLLGAIAGALAAVGAKALHIL
ncbi:MAG: hypothetical protein ACR652_10165 [Methylocystis sp.]|uniref:hypothetical protein n=1 Tax=Methylocystis sp. TaxID=1911079 RepID=UPI003DA68414